MTYMHLSAEQRGSALLITINRPKALNALASELVDELQAVIDQAAVDLSEGWPYRALILTGAGEKAFVAGADIREMSAMGKAEAEDYARRMHRVTLGLEGLPVPVIAAVNGYALGGGCELALAADLIYASANARFGQPEISLGLIPGFGGTVRLPQRVGPGAARELILTGRQVDAEEALRIGLADKVLPDTASLLEGALGAAEVIAAQSPTAVALSKRTLRTVAGLPTADGLEVETAAFGEAFTTADSRTGRDAFLAKEKPAFTGS